MPSSEVRLYKGIPFDRDYLNVLYADMKTAYSAFRTITSRSYQRPTKNVSHPKGFARSDYTVYITDFSEDFYECDYIAFKNPNGKWFYGFIDDVVKANNSCGEISYTIDAFQTWFVPAPSPFRQCYVRREIVPDDDAHLGLYIDSQEPISPAAYVHENDMQFGYTNFTEISGYYSILFIYNMEISEYLGTKGFTVSRLGLNGLDTVMVAVGEGTGSLFNEITTWLSENERFKSICACYYTSLPKPSGSSGGAEYLADYKITSSVKVVPDDIGGYKPRNKKLLYWPFRKIIVKDLSGESMELRPQDLGASSTGGVKLNIRYSALSMSKGLLYSNLQRDPDVVLPCTNYSMPVTISYEIPLSIDQAALYWSQNSTKDVLSSIFGTGVAAIGAASIALSGGFTTPIVAGALGVLSGISSITSASANAWINTMKAEMFSGSLSPGVSAYTTQMYGIQVYDVAASEKELQRFDDYFTKYGYAINRIVQPNITGRPTFNYVEIPDPIFNFTCPLSARQDLTAAFNRGVRLWHSANTFGDYSANNYNQG